jgi:hypothetical protein
MINKHKQKGAEVVEFAVVALLFFAVLFAIIEFGRALFVWNALTEATRRGARMAAICPVGDPNPKQVAIFDIVDGTLGTSPIVYGLTPDMVNIRYLDLAGAVTADEMQIKFVEARIDGYQHQLLIPLFGGLLPELNGAFITTLPSESLGAIPTYPDDPVSTPSCALFEAAG